MALLLVVAVLALLALLAAALSTLARLERQATAQRAETTRARLLARSGLEDAAARLSGGQAPDYGGEDWDGDGTLSSYEAAQEDYRRTGVGTPADWDACPAVHALRPSFFARQGPLPAAIRAGNRDRGVSTRLGSGSASVRVAATGGFHVNGGDPAAPPSVGYNAVLRRMLGTLAEAIDREDGADDGLPLDEGDGQALIDARPAAGWRHPSEIRRLALADSAAKAEAFLPYLTLHAWCDRRVIRPHATPAEIGSAPTRTGDILASRPETVAGSRAPDFERIGGRIVGRAPVSLAWARTRRPALIALLSGLKGVYLDETEAKPIISSDWAGLIRPAEIFNTWEATDDCHRIADQILVSADPLDTWEAWNAFCDALLVSDANDWNAAGTWPAAMRPARLALIQQAKRDLLKAAFNPNTDLNKFNPEAPLARLIDKSDLLVYSTELGLLPTEGHRIQAAGRSLGPDGRILALQVLDAEIGGPQVARLSTQREFACADLGSLDLPGDESGVRLPGQRPFISLSRGPVPTWGHRLPGLGGRGLSLQTYPEVCALAGTAVTMAPADYDGALMRATLETRDDDCFTVSAAPADMTLLACFTVDMDLAVADGIAINPAAKELLPDAELVPRHEMDRSAWDAVRPGTLRPDGCYSERGRAPSWPDKGSMHGFHGVFSFWAKPNYRMPLHIERIRQYVECGNYHQHATSDGGSTNQFFFLGDARKDINMPTEKRSFVGQFEVSHQIYDDLLEHSYNTPDRTTLPHTWYLITYFWDFRNPDPHDCGEVRIDAGTASPDQGLACTYPDGGGNLPLEACDLSADHMPTGGPLMPHVISLGKRGTLGSGGPIDWYFGGGADTTFDEFAVYDFGGGDALGVPPPAATLAAPGILASRRFEDGRFYAGRVHAPPGTPAVADEAPAYATAPITLPSGCRLRTVGWTSCRPPGSDEFVEWELIRTDGSDYLGTPESSRSSRAPGWTAQRQIWTAGHPVDSPFRLRAVFRRTGAVDPALPLKGCMALDDLTLLYVPPGGLPMLAWGTPD